MTVEQNLVDAVALSEQFPNLTFYVCSDAAGHSILYSSNLQRHSFNSVYSVKYVCVCGEIFKV